NTSEITFLQNNVNRQAICMHTCLQIGHEQKIDFILFQEPAIDNEQKYIISHPNYYCILPEKQSRRVRVTIYARKKSRYQFNQRLDLISDSDMIIGDIIDTKD